MRIAVLNRLREAYPGGDLVAIDATIAALKKRGVEAVYITDPWDAETLKAFDLVHVFHVNFEWCRINFSRVLESGMKYVVTPVFYPDLNLGATRKEIWDWCDEDRCSRVLPFSQRECMEMHRLTVDGNSLPTVIPNGTSEAFHLQNVDQWGRQVITVAARDGDKNTQRVKASCKRLGLLYRNVSGVAHEYMPLAYDQARVFVNLSGSERMSLTTGEALCAGCRVIDTTENWGNEWYPGIVTINPNCSDEELDAAIKNAYGAQDWDYTPNEAARKLTWDAVAEQLEQVYREAING